MRALVWFRSDLRVDDNPALSGATGAADRGVVAVFMICPRQWQVHDWGAARVAFLRQNVKALAQRLEALNIPLLVRTCATFAAVPNVLLAVAAEHQCDALYFNREYEVNESRRDDAVRRRFEAADRKVYAYDDQVVVPPGVLRTRTGAFHRTFSAFRRAWFAHVASNPDLLVPVRTPRRLKARICASDRVPDTVAGFATNDDHADLWPEGEDAAHRRLSQFIERQVRDYARRRDPPAADGTSRLSPYLTSGVLSPRRCIVETQAANTGRVEGGKVGPATWISELIWREFYRHILIGYPLVSMNRAFDPATEGIRWRADERGFDAWKQGLTGFPIVDAGMRQLAATGWMHNRARMITASFLVKDLLIDWRLGEQYFMRHLIDGDLASNNGGWQWCASTGADPVPYFRIFNPTLQARKFDPQGDYIRSWVPELRDLPESALHDPQGVPSDYLKKSKYPRPIVNHSEARQRALAAYSTGAGRKARY